MGYVLFMALESFEMVTLPGDVPYIFCFVKYLHFENRSNILLENTKWKQ